MIPREIAEYTEILKFLNASKNSKYISEDWKKKALFVTTQADI